MKRFVVSCFIALTMSVGMDAQTNTYNSVFPILNTVTAEPEFVVTSISQTYVFMGRTVLLSDIMYIRMGEHPAYDAKWGSDIGSFVSFRYVTKDMLGTNGEWNSGSEATQFAFHPGGLPNVTYYDSDTPMSIPLYAFTYSHEKGLNLVDLNGMNVVAKLDDGDDLTKYAYLTVFAGKGRGAKDIIVIAGKDYYKMFGTFVENGKSGVREISLSDSTPSYFGINGQKYDAPQQGLNIVVDGQETKKIIVK